MVTRRQPPTLTEELDAVVGEEVQIIPATGTYVADSDDDGSRSVTDSNSGMGVDPATETNQS